MSQALSDAVTAFVAAVGPDLRSLYENTGSATDEAAADAVVEALNLTTAFIDVDGRHGAAELEALIAEFGPRLSGALAHASPHELLNGYLTDRRKFLDNTSPMFEVLVAADAKNASHAATAYRQHAIDIGHAVASLDLTPSPSELEAIEALRVRLTARIDALPPVPAPEVAPEHLEDLLAELDRLVGLAAVKREVKLLTDLLRVENMRKKYGLPIVEHSRHLVFIGNPGTGKTTVARLLARIFKVLGVGAKGHLVEADRSTLVAGFIGQTAPKVRAVFEEALGGVLLIDEAHALARGDDRDFGREAIDTLVKLIEDHRDQIVVIVAGYPDEMQELIDTNPGLRSRFPKTIRFDDYSDDELMSIFDSLCTQSKYVCTESATAAVRAFFARQSRGKGFGNARTARNLFEASIAAQAGRLVSLEEPTEQALMDLTGADVEAAGAA